MRTSAMTQGMRDAIGIESEPFGFEVEKGDIVRYAQAIGDPNPLFRDEGQARRTRCGGIIAPPTYLIVMRVLKPASMKHLPGRAYARSLDGGSRWRYFEPIRPGDRLTATMKLAEVYERDGSLGSMLFQVFELTYVNQLGQVVATQRDTAIRY